MLVPSSENTALDIIGAGISSSGLITEKEPKSETPLYKTSYSIAEGPDISIT
jgi:hypothetical protein